jgi:hypothetical protein
MAVRTREGDAGPDSRLGKGCLRAANCWCGARYNNTFIPMVGIGSTDSLSALKTVFESGNDPARLIQVLGDFENEEVSAAPGQPTRTSTATTMIADDHANARHVPRRSTAGRRAGWQVPR